MHRKHLLVAFILVLLSSLLVVLPVSAQGGSTVGVGSDSNLGSFLVDANGMTLYTFTNDDPDVSNCVGQCLELWPAYTVASAEVTSAVELDGVLGTITRDDGSLQVTYNNQPLYLYTGDAAPGDVTGQGVGDVWFVVPVASPVLFATENPELGAILTDASNFTVYTFANDVPGRSNCVDACRQNWPPVVVSAETALVAGDGIPGLLGGLPQDDGTVHVTYYGQPLYRFSGDVNPGETNGQGAGDVWFAASLATVKIKSHPELGSILGANNGFALYTFTNDEANVSNCVGQCLELWPPYRVTSADIPLAAAPGVTGQLGTITRDDGTIQVTINALPLYYYSGDTLPAEVTGEGVGDVWFTINLDNVSVANNPELGTILTAPNGFTLYTYANDEPSWSNCVDECAEAWPPFTAEVEGAVIAPAALQEDFGTTLRADGTFQITFQGQPLYLFGGDDTPGLVNGNGAGGVWSVVPVSIVTASCNLTPSQGFANVRTGPGTSFPVSQELDGTAVVNADGQAIGDDSLVWWHLTTNDWVRSDVVVATGDCNALPSLERPASPAGSGGGDTTAPPVATEEPATDSGPTATEEP